ncbi:uncharacterized protein BO87DRAFT_317243, partial [Aspergillus neoniger CBS 115656]
FFKKYINKNLYLDYIRLFKSFINIFIFFISKKNNSLRLCVDYEELNKIFIKNYYFLSFILKILLAGNQESLLTKIIIS